VTKILPAYLTDGESVSHSFFASMFRLGTWVQNSPHGELMSPVCRRTSPGDIAPGRNQITAHWLDETDADWLWFIDTDMGFEEGSLLRLLAAAHPEERPVMGALCFTRRADVSDGAGGWRGAITPTLFGWDEHGLRVAEDYPRDRVTRVAGTGAAFLLIHRSAAEKIRAEYGDEWWTNVRYSSGAVIGEDLSFCWRLLKQDIPLHVDTSVKTTHAKVIWIGEQDFDGQA
jgi:GT2 family glycosyltransferase